MLQQTQVSRVIPAYRAFLQRFPTLRSLCRATLGDVLIAWGGLGYPRRARDLHRIARSVARLPRTPAGLDELPGVGAYTAGAVACFSRGERVAFADTNIRRVLGRAIIGRTATMREAIEIDATLMPAEAARWHHALMDLGATVCVARSPRCEACPILAYCVSQGRDVARAKRRQPAFATSDRRVRGAIMRLMRERRSATPREIARVVPDRRVPRLLRALAADGLIERMGVTVRLPL